MSTTSILGQRIGLGVFILWQLFYLAVANSLETLEVVSHPFPETSASLTRIFNASRDGEHPRPLGAFSSLIFIVDKYGQLTEQPQRWSLFAPNINDQTSFLACELRWDGQRRSLWRLSDNEPENPARYLRFLGNRVRSLEQNLTLSFAYDAGETEEAARRRWADQIQDKLAKDFDTLIAWSELRLQEFQQDYPDAPLPDEVILHVRGYEIPAPGAESRGRGLQPYSMPLARWAPAVEYPAEVLPIEAFDPATEQFVFQPWAIEANR